MTPNVGNADRILRILLGLVLIVLPFLVPAVTASVPALVYILPIAGAVLIATGLIRFCLLYTLLGINTGAKGKPAADA